MGVVSQEAELMIEDCINRSEHLTEWEEMFIGSINGKHNSLTEKQLEKLNQIWDRVTDIF